MFSFAFISLSLNLGLSGKTKQASFILNVSREEVIASEVDHPTERQHHKGPTVRQYIHLQSHVLPMLPMLPIQPMLPLRSYFRWARSQIFASDNGNREICFSPEPKPLFEF